MSNTKRFLMALRFLLFPLTFDQVPSLLCAATFSLMACFRRGQSERARAFVSLAGGFCRSQPDSAALLVPLAKYALGSFSHHVSSGAGFRIERRGPGAALSQVAGP